MLALIKISHIKNSKDKCERRFFKKFCFQTNLRALISRYLSTYVSFATIQFFVSCLPAKYLS
jgi:hypothetical protein